MISSAQLKRTWFIYVKAQLIDRRGLICRTSTDFPGLLDNGIPGAFLFSLYLNYFVMMAGMYATRFVDSGDKWITQLLVHSAIYKTTGLSCAPATVIPLLLLRREALGQKKMLQETYIWQVIQIVAKCCPHLTKIWTQCELGHLGMWSGWSVISSTEYVNIVLCCVLCSVSVFTCMHLWQNLSLSCSLDHLWTQKEVNYPPSR